MGEFAPCVAAPEGAVLQVAREQGIEVLPLSSFQLEKRLIARRPFQTLSRLIRAARTLSTHWAKRPAIIHANGQKALLPALWAARSMGVPCIWHVREYPERARLLRVMRRGIAGAIVPSAFMHDAVRTRLRLPESHVYCIPNGVQAPHTPLETLIQARQRFSLPSDAFVVAVIAQFVPWKRQEVVIAATKALSDAGVPVRTLLVGDDISGENAAYAARLRACALENGLKDCVHFLGHRHDVASVLDASDVLVLPSVQEPFGRVVVEAWHRGRAVVVADNGAPAQIVADGITGLHFHTDAAADLARRLDALHHSPTLRKQLAENGWREAERYTVEANATAVAELYERVLAQE
jgi:glycosyltransferase involved in cell wall biosynthesis